MDVQILIDLVRYAHIVAVAIGFGTAFLTEMLVLSRMGTVIDQNFINALRTYHAVIWSCVIAMWMTGLVMIYIRTGFDIANFSPKLFAKLFTVTVLTLNAQIIGRFLMPMVKASRGQSLLRLPLGAQIRLALIGATSTSSWMIALALGSSKVLAASGAAVFFICLPIVYGGAMVTAATAVCLFNRNGLSVQKGRAWAARLPVRR